MEIDITFDTYIVSNVKIQFCQKKKKNVLILRRSLIYNPPFYFSFNLLHLKQPRTVQ